MYLLITAVVAVVVSVRLTQPLTPGSDIDFAISHERRDYETLQHIDLLESPAVWQRASGQGLLLCSTATITGPTHGHWIRN
jgi:hypothetical protein